MKAASLQAVTQLPQSGVRQVETPTFSPVLHRLFLLYLHRYFAKHFHAVRTSGPAPPTDRPLVVYSNHPSWWDPIHYALLAWHETPGLRLYGPMEAKALEKYRFFKKLGVFGVDLESPRGAAGFLETGRAVLRLPQASLWMTVEGRFADPRNRAALRPGLAHLVRKLEDVRVVPLAIEYPFWNERVPEALTRFGPAITIDSGSARTVDEWTRLFEQRLAATMEALADDARTRDPRRFRTLVRGRAGVGGLYDRWRWLTATVRGRRFRAAHDDEGR